MRSNTELGLVKALENSHIFGDMDPTVIQEIVQSVEITTVAGGDIVFSQGEASNSMVLVITGRLIAKLTKSDGSQQTLSEIGPGSTAGELGLIMEQARAATVLAIRDSSIAVLNKQHFERLIQQHPIEMNRAITRTVFSYNTTLNRPPRHVSANIISLVYLKDTLGIASLGADMANSISKLGRVLLLNQDSIKSSGIANLGLINQLENSYDYIIIETNDDGSQWTSMALRQSDQLIYIADASDQNAITRTEQMVVGRKQQTDTRQSLVLIHDSTAVSPSLNDQWFSLFDSRDIYPIRTGHNNDFMRLCRFITDTAVGLVLGGGGARGLAHVGVIRALEQKNIPVDIVCGNSMGALIGAQYASGITTDSLIPNTQAFIKGGETPTFPLFSLLSGNRIKRDLKAMFSGIELQSMWTPFFCVSCNLSKADIHVHTHGPLWKAVLASNSPAGILPPVIEQGNLLVDAALLENVPVESMRQRLRFGTLIAVDVDVNEELVLDPGVQSFDKLNQLKRWITKSKEPQVPGILEIMNRAGHLGGLARRKQASAMADYYLQPPVARFGLMAYKKGDDIAEAAYQYADNEINQWPQKHFLL